jgi:hypothetical protein
MKERNVPGRWNILKFMHALLLAAILHGIGGNSHTLYSENQHCDEGRIPVETDGAEEALLRESNANGVGDIHTEKTPSDTVVAVAPIRTKPELLDSLRYFTHRNPQGFPLNRSIRILPADPAVLPYVEVLGGLVSGNCVAYHRKPANYLSEGWLFPYAGMENEVRLFLDGVPLRSDFALFRDIPVIATGLFEEIELLWNPPSTTAGAAAPSLVVNLLSPLPNASVPFSQVRWSMGSYELGSRLLHYRQNVNERTDISLSYRNVDSGGFRYNDDFEGGEFDVRILHLFPGHREISMHLMTWKESYGSPGPYVAGLETPTLDVERIRRQFQTSLNLTDRSIWTGYVGEVDRKETSLYYYPSGRDKETYAGLEGIHRFHLDTGSWNHHMTGGFRIESLNGYHWSRDVMTDEEERARISAIEKTAWLEDRLRWGESFETLFGITLIDHTYCGNAVSQCIRAGVPVFSTGFLTLSYNTLIIPPYFEVLEGMNGVEMFRGYTKHSILMSELEIPFHGTHRAGIMMKFSDNLFTPKILPAFSYERFDGTFAGSWWKGQFPLPGTVTLDILCNYLWTRRNDTDEDIPYQPEYSIRLGVSKNGRFFNDNLSVDLTLEGQHCASIAACSGDRFGPYNRLDFNISATIHSMTLYWRLRNITNETIYEVPWYPGPGQESEAGLVWNFRD